MAHQHEPWRQHESNRDEYQRHDRQQDREERYGWPARQGRGMSGYRPGEGTYRAGESRENRGSGARSEFENDAHGQGYWPAGYDDDRDQYGTDEYYGREDDRYPHRYSARESGRFRGVSRWRPRDPIHESRGDWVSEAGSTGPRWTGQYSPEQYRGPHRGKGPKGYMRSDERLREIISERLMDDPQIDASDITVEVTGQVVTLTGTVESRLIKYQVEELVENCGVQDVINNLRIRRAGQEAEQLRPSSRRGA